MPHLDDNGGKLEVVEMRKHVRKFRKKMKGFRKWVESYAIRTVPFYFIANAEVVVEEMDFESCDEDYSYDEDSDGNMKKRKRKYKRNKCQQRRIDKMTKKPRGRCTHQRSPTKLRASEAPVPIRTSKKGRDDDNAAAKGFPRYAVRKEEG